MIDWESIREQFSVTQPVACLNTDAAGPLPRPVMEAASSYYQQMMEELGRVAGPERERQAESCGVH